MAKLETYGYKPWWPMKEFMGRGPKGQKLYGEVYRNMQTGEAHFPQKDDGESLGWDGEPPELPNGEKSQRTAVNNAYRRGYEQIRWDR
jgi:hypothetical protein